MTGPFKVDEGIKLNSDIYYVFMDNSLFAWYKSHSYRFKVKRAFMHYNSLSRVSEFFEDKRFTQEKITEWSLSNADLIVIENSR